MSVPACITPVMSHPNNHIPNEQDLAKLNEARKVREVKAKEKKERLEKAQARRARKAQQDKKDLEDAKKILRRGRGRRSVCDKRLSCHAVELLCLAMGLRDQVYARHGKRLLQKDLRTLFWSKYTHDTTVDDNDTYDTTANDNDTHDTTANDSSWDSDDNDSDTDYDLFAEDRPTTRKSTRATRATRKSTRTTPTSPTTTPTSPDTDDIPCWNGSDEDTVHHSEAVPFMSSCKVNVLWPGMNEWYVGTVVAVDQADATFRVQYDEYATDDDEFHWHDLSWKVQLIE